MNAVAARLTSAVLLRDHAAGNAVARVAGGIGLVVVGFGVDDDCGAPVAEQRMRAVAESHVVVLQFRIGLAFRVDGKVLHVPGVVAFGILEPVLLGFGIEMRASRFKIGAIALGSLMKVNGVFSGRQIVKVKLQAGAGSLLPQRDRTDILALSVLKFDFGFGCAGQRGNGQNNGEGDEGEACMFHAGIIANFAARLHKWAMLDPQGGGVYFDKV